jgi:anti-sigma factor RsiW
MTDEHLAPNILSAFADGELSGNQAAEVKLHLDSCLTCSSNLIDEWLIKASISKVGRRFDIPAAVEQRVHNLLAQGPLFLNAPENKTREPRRTRTAWLGFSGWAVAATLLMLIGWSALNLRGRHIGSIPEEAAALVSEASDLHIATLAPDSAPQVISSDRHTVKPWFQGKLPFSFNLPESLPAGTRLDGANLVYLNDQPVAQLLFSIGLHHASVFIEQRKNSGPTPDLEPTHAGFQVVGFTTENLEAIAVSDVQRHSLMQLAKALESAQSDQ